MHPGLVTPDCLPDWARRRAPKAGRLGEWQRDQYVFGAGSPPSPTACACQGLVFQERDWDDPVVAEWLEGTAHLFLLWATPSGAFFCSQPSPLPRQFKPCSMRASPQILSIVCLCLWGRRAPVAIGEGRHGQWTSPHLVECP